MAAFGKYPIGRDVFERALKSFIQGALAVAITQGVSLVTIVDLDFWKSLVMGGVMAVLSLVTSTLSTLGGKKGASADPAVGLAPLPAA